MSEYIDPKYRNLRNLLLLANGEITPEIKEEVERITRGEDSENFNKVLSSINANVSTEDILARISRVPLPQVFLNSITSTFKTSIAPVKLSFMEEVQNYVKTISENNAQTIRKIPRVVNKTDLKKLENGKFVQAFPNADSSEKVINPEFKNLLFNGYKPKDAEDYEQELRTGIKKIQTGTPDSDYLKNYLGNDEPSKKIEEIPYTTSRPAGLMIDSYKLKDDEVNIRHDNTKLIINITGTMRIENINSQLLNSSFFSELPSWKISYLETKDKYFLNIKNDLNYFPISRTTPETSSYRFSGKMPESSLSQEALNLIGSLSDQCDVQLGDDLFSSLFSLNGVIKQNIGQIPRDFTAEENVDFKQYLRENYKEIFDSIVRQSFGNLNNNRLLQNFVLNQQFDSNINLIILNLINFIPNPSQELIDCGKNPHPLNIDEVLGLMTQKFSDIGLDVVPREESIEIKKDPTTEALSVGVCYLLVRLLVFEYVLKNLIVFDELGYSSVINKGPIIKDYLSILVKKELDQNNIYKFIESIVEENFNFFKTNNIIIQEDIEEQQDDEYSVIVDNSLFIKPSKNFKIFTTAILRKVVGFIKNLIGVSEEDSKNDLLISNKIYNVVSKNNLDINVQNKHKQLDIQRLQDFNEFRQFLLFEKYINSPTLSPSVFKQSFYPIIQNYQNNNGAVDITSFKEYSSFLYNLINFEENFNSSENINDKDIKQHIKNNGGKIKSASTLSKLVETYQFKNTIKPKIGIRLNYVKREKIHNFNTNRTVLNEFDSKFQTPDLSQFAERFSNNKDRNGNNIYDKEKEYTREEVEQILLDLVNRESLATQKRQERIDLSQPSSELDREKDGLLQTSNGDDQPLFIVLASENFLPPDAILSSRWSRSDGVLAIPSLPGDWKYQKYKGAIYESEYEAPGQEKALIVINSQYGITPNFEWLEYIRNEKNYWQNRVEQLRREETNSDFTGQEIKNITGLSNEQYSQVYEQESTKFYIKNNNQRFVNIVKEQIIKNRQYCIFDDNIDGIYQFNSLPISHYEIDLNIIQVFQGITDISILSESDINVLIKQFFESKKQDMLLNLKNSSRYQLIINKSIGIERINNLMSIYSTSAISNPGVKNLFFKTKENLYSLIKTAQNLDDYEYKSDIEKNGYDNLYMKDLQKIGDPNADPNILKFLIQTPILILKGLLNVTDPNMSLAFLIQDIAASGLLFPKLDEQGRVAGYPGDRLIIPSSLLSIAQLPINLFGIPPAGFGIGPPISLPYGPIFWLLEPLLWDLPFYKNILNQQKDAIDLERRYNGLKLSTNFTCSKNQDDN